MTILLALAGPAQAAFPGDNGKIATARYEFVGHGAGSPDVYTVNPDGSGATALTDDDTSSLPAWSADGKRIAFVKVPLPQPPDCESSCAYIYVMNADGTGLTKLTTGSVYDYSPAWSPDGSKVVFASYRSGNSDIYTMNADGSGVTRITTHPEWDTAPAWSPRGDEIAFARSSGANGYTLHVMRADGSGERLLVPGRNPNWSPDGNHLAYDDQSQIWVVNADGTGALKLTTEPVTTYPDGPYFLYFNKNPAWSPNGSKIAFEHGECSWGACFPPRLETVNPDGSGRAPIASGQDSSGGEPDWQALPPSPNGYARPKGATPVNVRFVPAYEQCSEATPPGSTHGPPLAVPSCQPPRQSSLYLTMGTGDSNGKASQFMGALNVKQICNPACSNPGDQADVKLDAQFTDVRNVPDLTDYLGELQVSVTLRMTDRTNGAGGIAPATAVDVPFSFAVPCSGDLDTTVGSTCSVSTTADAVNPGIVPEGKRSVWQLGQVQVYDGGADGDADTTGDNTLYMTQGLFAP